MTENDTSEQSKDVAMYVRLGCVFAFIAGTIAIDYVPKSWVDSTRDLPRMTFGH